MSDDTDKKQRQLSRADAEEKANYLIDKGYVTNMAFEELVEKMIKPEGWTAPSHEGNHGDLKKAL